MKKVEPLIVFYLPIISSKKPLAVRSDVLSTYNQWIYCRQILNYINNKLFLVFKTYQLNQYTSDSVKLSTTESILVLLHIKMK